MSFSQIDINCLLTFLEKELQSRDARISELKSEKSLGYLYDAKYNQLGFYEANYVGKHSINKSGGRPLVQLEDLIVTQQKAQSKLKEQIKLLLEKYNQVCTEIESAKTTHENIIETNNKLAIVLIEERNMLNVELQELKLKNEKLETDSRKHVDKIQYPEKQRTVVDKLVKRRKTIQEQLETYCQKCTLMEHMVEEAKIEVTNSNTKLKSTREEISRAIEDISQPFHEQVNTTTNEFLALKSKIKTILSSNEHIELKIKHLNEAQSQENVSQHNLGVQGSQAVNGSVEKLDQNIHNSLIDTFDSTIKMLEKEIECSNLLRHKQSGIATPPHFRISAPHPTPNKPAANRVNQRVSQKITSFESMMNSNNAFGQVEHPKSFTGLSNVPVPTLNLIPPTPTLLKSSLPAVIPSSIVANNIRSSSLINSYNLQSNVLPLAPPPSPVGKKLPPLLTSRGKQPPPALPSKPQVIGPKSVQPKSLGSAKHLIMPSKTLS